MQRYLAWLLAALTLASLGWWALAGPGASDALWHIVQQQCLPDWQQHANPAPCVSVTLQPNNQGFVLLHDRKGGAHFLLIPTRAIRGIESPELLTAAVPNYFARAWESRAVLDRWLQTPVPRTAVGLAVNSAWSRSQNQLHIHIGCLRPALRAALDTAAAQVDAHWRSLDLAGRRYQALRLAGDELAADPFKLVAAQLAPGGPGMSASTLLVVGMRYVGRPDAGSAPGFLLLAARGPPGAEAQLDPGCALVRRPAQS